MGVTLPNTGANDAVAAIANAMGAVLAENFLMVLGLAVVFIAAKIGSNWLHRIEQERKREERSLKSRKRLIEMGIPMSRWYERQNGSWGYRKTKKEKLQGLSTKDVAGQSSIKVRV